MPVAAAIASVAAVETVAIRREAGALLVSATGADGAVGVAATLDEPAVARAVERFAADWRGSDPLAFGCRYGRRSKERAATGRAERLAFGAFDLALVELGCAQAGVPLEVFLGAATDARVATATLPADALDADTIDEDALGAACLATDATALAFSLPLAGGLAGIRRITALARALDLRPVARLVTGTEVERVQAVRLARAFGFAIAAPAPERSAAAAHRPSRIRRIRLRRVKLPLAQIYVSAMYLTDHVQRTLVEIETDDGLVGLGETAGVDEVFRLVAKLAKGRIGTDALDRRGLARAFGRIGFDNRNGRNGWQALAGLEIACADLAAKRLGVPLVRMLGGADEASAVRAVCVLPSAMLDALVPRAELAGHFADLGNTARVAAYAVSARERHGFTCFKYKSAGVGAAWDLAVLRGLRDALGPAAELRVDPNAAYDAATAAEVCRALEPLSLEYYEDPTDGIEGLVRVKRRVTRPLASNMVVVEFGQIAPAARRGAPDIVLADLFHWAFEGYRDMAAAVEALGLTCAIHSFYESGVATAANVHLALGLGVTKHASDQGHDELADDVLEPGSLEIRDGMMALPPGPGIGVVLDEARVRRLLVDEVVID